MSTDESNADLSPAQREIMELVWRRGELSAFQVRGLLLDDGRDVARNTVRTLLERMEAKGWLTHRVDGRTFLYSAVRAKVDAVGRKVRELVDQVCGGSPETLVAALLDHRGLKPGELRRIRQMLDEAKAVRSTKGDG